MYEIVFFFGVILIPHIRRNCFRSVRYLTVNDGILWWYYMYFSVHNTYSRRLRNWNMYHCIWASSPWRYSPVNSFFRHSAVLRWSGMQDMVLACLDSFQEEYLHNAVFRSVQFTSPCRPMVWKWSLCAGFSIALNIFNTN
jgi:hypothetical protein